MKFETLAADIDLNENFKTKASKAVRLFMAGDQIRRLFKQLHRHLIRPLGDDLMKETIRILDDEISKLEESDEKSLLKTVQRKLDCLMHFITDSWADLDE
ncbi:Protein CBG02678 [Caenorhabditis briggsae]|nr:Protein CBG02678 [Caenorhabditis briggsae]ULU06499.1 hypothetical protein L3Y34_018388 [Caenorhabditis briggsae]CAP23881.1 Protein CBG02678 [Caenorhabditis briggsae]